MVVLAKPLWTCLYKHMQFSVIILAAGQGKRLKSAIPKPLHLLGGRPLLNWVTEVAKSAGTSQTLIVTPADTALFSSHISEDSQHFIQDPAQGTGHAVVCTIEALSKLLAEQPVIILYADTPLIQPDTIRKLTDQINRHGSDLCCLALRQKIPLAMAGW